jgi:hypothetical protein
LLQVGVTHRRLDVRVAEDLLDLVDAHPVLDQPRRVRVAQGVDRAVVEARTMKRLAIRVVRRRALQWGLLGRRRSPARSPGPYEEAVASGPRRGTLHRPGGHGCGIDEQKKQTVTCDQPLHWRWRTRPGL